MMEIELQLLMEPAHNEALLAHPLIAAHARGPARSDDLTAHYFDTPSLHLLRHRAGLRVRRMDGVWIQTLKARGSMQSGLHQQHEWETPVLRAWPQLGKLRKAMDAKQRDMLDQPGLKNDLEVLFTVAVQRTRWDIDFEGSQIELALDCGHIEREGRQLPVNEVELELKAGTPASLFAFALRLLDDIPLRLSYTNKAMRGYALCHDSGIGIGIVKAAPVELPHGASTAQALVAILSNCLQQIQGNEAGVTGSDDPESVHQLRVGVRRLRSALKLFGDLLPCPPALLDDIEWLGGALGAARDWEVLRDTTLPRVPEDEGTGQPLLRALVEQTARTQRDQAAQALLSPRYTRLQLALALWMQQTSASDDAAHCAPASRFAHRAMRELHKKMLRRAEKAAGGEERAVHRLRIAGKRVRYALEFFASLYQRGSSTRYLAALTEMQDVLGRHNDVMVADRLLRELLQQHPDAANAIHFARGYLLGQAANGAAIDDFRQLSDASHLPRRA